MDAISFDDLEQAGNAGNNRKPFFALDNYDESTVFDWLKQDLATLKGDSWMRLEKVRNNYLRYKGIQYSYQIYVPRDLPEVQKRYMPQMVVPVIRDMIDEKVARLLEVKPGLAILPMQDSTQDKVDAKIAKRFLQHIDYTERMDAIYRKWVKNAKIAGESFLGCLWDPDKGSTHPLYKPGMKDQAGQELAAPVKVGDIRLPVKSPMDFFYENVPSKVWEDVSYCYDIDYVYTEALKRDYPDKAQAISPNAKSIRLFDMQTLQEKEVYGATRKITFYYKHDKYLRKGFQVVFCDSCLLEMGPLKYEHGELPFERLVGTTNEEELHGESSIEPVRGIASQITNMTNMMIKQIMLCAHPKWMVESGSVDEQQLNNDAGIVRLKAGARAPVLSQSNPISEQTFDFRDKLKEEFYQFAKSNSVVQGEPPTGVTAFVALQYVSESENRRSATEVAELNQGFKGINNLILQTCGQYYKKDDKRTMWIIGKDANWSQSSYDPASLAKPFNIEIQNTSALPDSKALRTQFVMDLTEKNPGLIPQEQQIEMLGLAQADKFMDVGSAAARAAEDENESILDGKGQVDPKIWEDHITHWKVHTMAIQGVGFKTKTDPKDQKIMTDHILATEMLMMTQAQKSSSFAQQLSMIPQFPMFYFTPPSPPSANAPPPSAQPPPQQNGTA